MKIILTYITKRTTRETNLRILTQCIVYIWIHFPYFQIHCKNKIQQPPLGWREHFSFLPRNNQMPPFMRDISFYYAKITLWKQKVIFGTFLATCSMKRWAPIWSSVDEGTVRTWSVGYSWKGYFVSRKLRNFAIKSPEHTVWPFSALTSSLTC